MAENAGILFSWLTYYLKKNVYFTKLARNLEISFYTVPSEKGIGDNLPNNLE
jgi:hypothetical protein